MKTDELTGAALDWAVSHCVEWSRKFPIMPFKVLPYSTDWAQGGPIIDREKINIEFDPFVPQWFASYETGEVIRGCSGLTPLIAAMRCYVVNKLGNEVELPKEISK